MRSLRTAQMYFAVQEPYAGLTARSFRVRIITTACRRSGPGTVCAVALATALCESRERWTHLRMESARLAIICRGRGDHEYHCRWRRHTVGFLVHGSEHCGQLVG